MRKSLVVVQMGGPTAVINASLAGLLAELSRYAPGLRLLGAHHGFEGLLERRFIELDNLDSHALTSLATTPGSALGSSRRPLRPEDGSRLLAVLREQRVHQFVVIGGNGSMAALARVAAIAEEAHVSLQAIGIPKTVDNDLVETDHCPGYGSAARFLALATRDAGLDLEAMATFDDVVILETMGRHTGWLAAATALARQSDGDAPHLILLPERPLTEEIFLANVERLHRKLGRVFIVVSEGVRDRTGQLIGGSGQDALGRPVFGLASGAGDRLAARVKDALGFQVRCYRPGLVGRALAVAASQQDRHEADQVGRAAARYLKEGVSNQMVTLVRDSEDPYRCTIGVVPLARVANRERPMPDNFIAPSAFDVTAAFLAYARPIVGAIPPPFRLDNWE